MTRWRRIPALSTRRTTSSTLSSYASSPKSRHTMIAACGSAAGRGGSCNLLGVLLGSQGDRARRHDSRNGVLVDHLRHRIAQQHDVLVERLDLALQLDAVDQ